MAIKRITDLPLSRAANLSAYTISNVPNPHTGDYTKGDNANRLCALFEVSEQTSKGASTYDSKSIDYKALLSSAIIPDVYAAIDARNQLGNLKIRADIISGDTKFYGSKTMEGLNVTSAFQCGDLTCGNVACGTIDAKSGSTWQAINCGPLDIHGNSFTCGELYVKSGTDMKNVYCGDVNCTSLKTNNGNIDAGSGKLTCTGDAQFGTAYFGGSADKIKITATEIQNVDTFTCGTLKATKELAVNTNKFTVDSNGATTCAGSLNCGGALTCVGHLYVSGGTGGKQGGIYTENEDGTYGGKVHAGAFSGTAYRALWGDIAERYIPDQPYEAGTLVKFGGEQEITLATDKANAVISDKPAFTLADNLKDAIPVALAGRVPVKVVGPICKFDRLMLDTNNPGCAILASDGTDPIAVALESSSEADVKLVLCATHFNLR